MPVVWWAIAGGIGLLGWGAKSAQEETGKGLADGLRFALPIAAVGVAVYMWHKGGARQ